MSSHHNNSAIVRTLEENHPDTLLAHELHIQGVSLYNQLGQGNPEAAVQAIELLEKSVSIVETPESLIHLAKLHMVVGSNQKAIDRTNQCLNKFFPIENLKNVSTETHFLNQEFARNIYRQAQRILGQAYAQLAQYENAIVHLRNVHTVYQFQKTTTLAPSTHTNHSSRDEMENEFDLAYALLALQRYEEGWKHYRARYQHGFDAKLDITKKKIPTPLWDGDLKALKGNTIILLPEQGYGDQIQFSRCAKFLREAGANVWILSSPASFDLMQNLPWQDRVVGEDFREFDAVNYWSTVLHASAMLALNPYSNPIACPYLYISSTRKEKFLKVLSSGHQVFPKTTKTIAINWRGNPNHINDKSRSMTLAEMINEVKRHLDLLGVRESEASNSFRLVSIQMSPTEAELEMMQQQGIQNLASEIQDFTDMAAALENVDHLLTIDSAPVHLAGALNIPATLLVPPRIDWRWGCLTEAPPWYKSIKLRPQLRLV